MRNVEEVCKVIRAAVMSKQYGNEEFLSRLIAQACILIMPEKSSFNVDNVRVCKILGAGISSSTVIRGMVFKRTVESNVQRASNAKVAVYSCVIDIGQTETKGTVLIKTAAELQNFSKGEENVLEEQIKSIADTGVKIVVSGGKVGDMALHFLNKYELMSVRLPSKFDVRRLCKTIGATVLPRLTSPTNEEAGFVSEAYVDEVGDTPVVVFRQDSVDSAVSTIVVRGSTENIMDDIERAIDDGVNTFKAYTRDPRYVPGAGAVELEISSRLATYAESCAGLEQYAIKKYAEAFEIFPKTLAQNAGVKSTEVLSKLYTAHHEGKQNYGYDNEGEGAAIKDCIEAGIWDSYLVKTWGIKFATSATVTVLQVDQIIMAKEAGGPKPKKNEAWDED